MQDNKMPLTSQFFEPTKECNGKEEKEEEVQNNHPEGQLLPIYPIPSIFACLQILCGCLAIFAGLCAYVVGTWRSEYGIGVWSGMLYVASGVAGFIAKHRKDNRTLLGFFFSNAFVAGVTVAVIVFHVMILRNEDKNVTKERLFNIPSFSQETRRGLDAIQTILAITALIIMLAGCRSVYIHLCGERFQNIFTNHEKRRLQFQCC